jgi:hypothetical protein
LKNTRSIILLLLFVASLTPIFLGLFESKEIIKVPPNESYEPQLSRLDNIPKLTNYIDSVVDQKKIAKTDTLQFVLTATEVVKQRFHYGFSNYTFATNWPAYVGGKLIWSHLSAVVDPDDILKHSEGLCSQQTIVFLDILRQKGIPFRSVGLGPKEGPGHFLCEVHYDGDWHVYDITMEPNWQAVANAHKSMMFYKNNKDTLFTVYKDKIPSEILDKMLVEVNYGKTNSMPARNMLLFHKTCKGLVYLVPFLPLWFVLRIRKRKID